MTNTEYNQALIKKAHAGLVRFQGMQKMAGGENPLEFGDTQVLSSLPPSYYSQVEQASQSPKVDLNRVKVTNSFNGDYDVVPDEPAKQSKPSLSNPYLQYAAGGAGVGALVGALVNLVRNKSLLSGALGGALIGGGLGAGHQALRDKVEGYADKNPIDPWISKGQEAWGNLKSKFNA